jgi:hypothetical protein
MPVIPSANFDFPPNPAPTQSPEYFHPAKSRFGTIPMAFQITSPLNVLQALLPHALVMHVNPANFNETFTKRIERFQTRGGFVEQHWGDELSEIAADGSTGAFMNLYTGTSSLLRQSTIAWDRYRDLHDLYRNNGDVYDPYGNIVLKGNVMLMYDKGTYVGYFSTFEIEETDGSPFTFSLSWNFKVEQIVQQIPGVVGNTGVGVARQTVGVYPPFQAQNTVTNTGPASVSNVTNAFSGTATGNDSANAALQAQAQSLATEATIQKSIATSGINTVTSPNVPQQKPNPVATSNSGQQGEVFEP